MKPIHIVLSCTAITVAFWSGTLFQKYGVTNMGTTTYIKSSEPLLLNAGEEPRHYYMLPPNTPMYRDISFPEGFTRFIIYVNVKGPFAAEQIVSDKANLIDPIWAFTIEKDEVSELLAAAPVSKVDLTRILKARGVTCDELAQIVREWKD